MRCGTEQDGHSGQPVKAAKKSPDIMIRCKPLQIASAFGARKLLLHQGPLRETLMGLMPRHSVRNALPLLDFLTSANRAELPVVPR